MKGEDRKTHIDQIFKKERNTPNPHTYETKTTLTLPRVVNGKVGKNERDNFLCETEYLSMNNPTSKLFDMKSVQKKCETHRWHKPKE